MISVCKHSKQDGGNAMFYKRFQRFLGWRLLTKQDSENTLFDKRFQGFQGGGG